MTEDSLLGRLQGLLAHHAGPRQIPPRPGPDTPLAEEGYWLDSVALLELVLACEEEFGIVFDPVTDLVPDHLRTVGTLAALIEARRLP